MVPVREALYQRSALSRVVYVELPIPARSIVPSPVLPAPRVLFVPPLSCDPSLDPRVTIPRKHDPAAAAVIALRYAPLWKNIRDRTEISIPPNFCFAFLPSLYIE